jgi:heme-degrading monooxygenase HmoA
MFTVIYRWRIKPDLESAFRTAWHNRTEKIYAVRGSYGSRLHREPDGTYCVIALWPSCEAWEAPEPPLPDDEADAATFRDSVAEWLPTLTMETVDDLWRLPG